VGSEGRDNAMTPTSPTQRIVASYSFLNELENCPFKAYETRVARSIQRIETEPQRWGNYVHDAMDKRVGDSTPLPEDLDFLEPFARVFDSRSIQTEMKICVNANGLPIKWYGEGAYAAGKIDVVLTHRLDQIDFTDWKTGKDTYETPFELELHALLHAAAIAPIRATYTGRYCYVGRVDANGDPVPDKVGQTYNLSDVGATWSKVNSMMARAHDYQQRGEWPATPNPLCGWCPVMKCQHNKVKQREAREAAK
jgi:hypothetical protein